MLRLRAILTVLVLATSAPALAQKPPKPPGPPPDPTLHLFRETTDGGEQEVLADSYVSHAGVVKIQQSLRKQAAALAHGAYPDPGGTPATAKLHAGASKINVTYSDLRRGGVIRFRSSDAQLVAALHEWMAATVQAEQKLHHDGGPGEG